MDYIIWQPLWQPPQQTCRLPDRWRFLQLVNRRVLRGPVLIVTGGVARGRSGLSSSWNAGLWLVRPLRWHLRSEHAKHWARELQPAAAFGVQQLRGLAIKLCQTIPRAWITHCRVCKCAQAWHRPDPDHQNICSCVYFFDHGPNLSWNDRKKFSQFDHNVWNVG